MGFFPELDVQKGALFSPCRLYRYVLWRVWDPSKRKLVVIGLNPSKADEHADDNTIRKLLTIGKRQDFGSLFMLNEFAFRSTDPQGMKNAKDPIGPDNDSFLERYATQKGSVVCVAWGADGDFRTRDRAVLDLLERLRIRIHCFGLTKEGHPRHPLFLRSDTNLQEWGFQRASDA